MKKLETKSELEKWIIAANNVGYSVPCVINGGGFSWIKDWEKSVEITGLSLTDDSDYDDDLEYLDHGEEFVDFKQILSPEEYESMIFVRVNHYGGYSKENMDLQFGIYEIDEIEP